MALADFYIRAVTLFGNQQMREGQKTSAAEGHTSTHRSIRANKK